MNQFSQCWLVKIHVWFYITSLIFTGPFELEMWTMHKSIHLRQLCICWFDACPHCTSASDFAINFEWHHFKIHTHKHELNHYVRFLHTKLVPPLEMDNGCNQPPYLHTKQKQVSNYLSESLANSFLQLNRRTSNGILPKWQNSSTNNYSGHR